MAERFAEGNATLPELREAEQAASGVPGVDRRDWTSSEFSSAATAAAMAANFQGYEAATAAVLAVERCRGERPEGEVRRWLCDLLREVFGNPFRPVVLDHAWLRCNDGLAPRLAREIYDERSFDELPVLADALEDAGCDHRELLDHLRRPGGHVRGCWALDTVLDLR